MKRHFVSLLVRHVVFLLQIATQVFTIMVTGAETTASAITFTLYHVAATPAAEARFLEEVDTFGRSAVPGYDDLNKVRRDALCAQWVVCRRSTTCGRLPLDKALQHGCKNDLLR